MTAPQIIMVSLLGISVGMHVAMHGQPRSPYHAGSALVGLGLNLGLLYWGGFFG